MKSLQAVSNKELLENLNRLCTKETEVTLEVILHLIEVDKRRLYLELGYSSLFNYCHSKLKYSEPAAARRVSAAKCIRDYPEIYELLLNREVSLSTLALIAGVLTKENYKEILVRTKNKSKREVEGYLAGFKPKTYIKEYIKPVVIKGAKMVNDQSLFSTNTPLETSVKENFSNSAQATTLSPQHATPPAESLTEPREYEIKFKADKNFIDKLQKVRAIMSKGPVLAQVFEALMDEYLRSREPKRLAKKTKDADGTTRPQAVTADKIVDRSRYITKTARSEILKRAEYRCNYIADDGKRCECRTALQIDHIWPHGKGGTNDISNLRLLCTAHNRLMAEKHYGREKILHFARCLW